jgi:hypothetical protein
MGFAELKSLKWLKAAAEEIISGIKNCIEELNPQEVERFIQLLLAAK